MRFIRAAACSFALAAALVSAQQAAPSAITDTSANPTAPVLLSTHRVELSTEKCKKKYQASNDIRFSLLVTSDGEPRRITFLRALGNDLDHVALDLVHADRFAPAKKNGESVPAWQSIDVTFQSCREDPKDKTEFPTFTLISQPAQKLATLGDPPKTLAASSNRVYPPGQTYRIGGNVSPPVPLNTPEAHYSNEARKKKIQGVCMISLIVDAEGMPQNPRVARAAGYGLDGNALEAVRHYRFKPALKGDDPVPVMMSIEVNFRLY